MNMNLQYMAVVDEHLFTWMQDIRRQLHRNPELSFAEYRTADLIKQKLSELGIPFSDSWGGTGVRAVIEGGVDEAGHVALRADMDALPVIENSGADYGSRVEGVMHACGHDGHVAMLLGAASLLKKRPFPGKVSLIFQPAEEFGNGAEKLVQEGILSDGVEAIFAGHIDTHFPVGCITVDEGLICSYADAFSLEILGRGGHAARPHESRDALVAGAHLVTSIQTMMAREIDPSTAAVLTIGQFKAGSAHNVIADRAILRGTIRASSITSRKNILEGLQRICEAVGIQHRVEVRLTMTETLPAVINSKSGAETARAAAIHIVGAEGVVSQGKPSLGGEDFAFYLEKIPGCLVRFGARGEQEYGAAHSATFDFDEQVLTVGSRWLAEVAVRWLTNKLELAADD